MAKRKKICAGGLILKDDLFLFGKRATTKRWAAGLWDIAGGHAHRDEKVLDALKRELHEEVGIIIKNAELLLITDVWDESDNRFFEYHIYMITSYEGEPENCSEEHSEIKWFSLDELRILPLALPIYPELISQWLQKQKA